MSHCPHATQSAKPVEEASGVQPTMRGNSGFCRTAVVMLDVPCALQSLRVRICLLTVSCLLHGTSAITLASDFGFVKVSRAKDGTESIRFQERVLRQEHKRMTEVTLGLGNLAVLIPRSTKGPVGCRVCGWFWRSCMGLRLCLLPVPGGVDETVFGDALTTAPMRTFNPGVVSSWDLNQCICRSVTN